MHLIATAGHVDHGKSTLVRALTGIEPDRLAEEKKRGLTIDLGFAWTELPSGHVISFVDVPGHSRFLKNMLAGIGAADAVLFVVSAAEGWKPQSEEHLRIMQLLGFDHGIVALTHSASVDDDIRELAQMDLEDHLAGTFLETAPVIEVDVPKDHGIAELTAALDTLTSTTPSSSDHGRPRLWIDRVFAIEGAGTVVTGSLTDGRITNDQELLLLPQRRAVRVRGIQSRGNQTDSVGPGERTAVNLSGISHHEITRGDVLVLADQWHETATFDVDLHVLETLDHEVRRRGAYVVHIGSGHFRAQLRILGDEALLPGESGPARIHLPTALPLLPGDRFILRDSGREATIGGGEILDVDPISKASAANPDRDVQRLVAERGIIDVHQLELLTGQTQQATIGRWVLDADYRANVEQTLRTRVAEAGSMGVDLATLDDLDRSLISELDDLVVDAVRVRHADAIDPLEGHSFPHELEQSLFAPPAGDQYDRTELRELTRRGTIVELDGIHYSPNAAAQASQTAALLLRDNPEGFTVSEFKDALATSRKFAMPLLSHLDANGMTRRRGDVRIAGPRLPGT